MLTLTLSIGLNSQVHDAFVGNRKAGDFGRIDQHDDFMNYFTFPLESDETRNTKHDTIKMKGSRYDSLMGDPVVEQKDLKISQ